MSNMEVSLAAIGACGGTVKWLLGRCIPCLDSINSNQRSKYNKPNGSSSGYNRERKRRKYFNVETAGVTMQVNRYEYMYESSSETERCGIKFWF
ncbi:hypothetical protein K469DRAFT_807325 [Zopfia rhizophila CBS 207.26]|uniref:Uncharacterized protein n=1 Tax=Zopfia rhizophila CBS 207.26 TaxID=1314779 RepID=A0A6A6DDR4_9PEZI|nr:hypothetical protein K469DRAFT_807325 [Zopfia rhizophila CBS 207.26]